MKKMKQLFILLFALVLVIPFSVNAEKKNLTKEEETEKEPVKVYVFHGDGCPHCEETFEWFDSIEEEYGKYFELVKFEVWYSQANSEFMQTVANKMGDEAGGVPYIIVGKYTWPNGFAPDATIDKKGTTMAKDMITKIMDVYNSKDRYDVMDGLEIPSQEENNNNTEEETEKKEKNNDNIVAVVSVVVIAGLIAVAVITRRNSK